MVAPIVERPAISRLAFIASSSPGTANGCIHASSEKSCQTKLKRPSGSLNENSRMIAIGVSRYSSASPA